jgi:hypothetical protein
VGRTPEVEQAREASGARRPHPVVGGPHVADDPRRVRVLVDERVLVLDHFLMHRCMPGKFKVAQRVALYCRFPKRN